jgi:hypothetical protein
MMKARPELALVSRSLNENNPGAILIGNLAAALHAAPVMTIDIDLIFKRLNCLSRKIGLCATRL